MTSGNNFDEALEEATKYFAGEALSARVFVDKYALRDNEGNIIEKNPDDLHKRLAREFARIDSEKYNQDYDTYYSIYYDALKNFQRIVAQGSPMAAIGNPYQIMSASNCVVVDSPEDSIAGIMQVGQDMAQLMKRRCGVGVDISTLRPDGFSVNNAARTTSGAWSFADYYSYVTRMIGQSGRRGALMVTLDVHHPDVVQFTKMKHDKTKVTGANVSVRLSNEFLKAVDEDTDYEQRWPCDSPTPKFTKMVRARDVWEQIVESATNTAEPGLIFWDNMQENLPANYYPDFKSKSTNPCSEISLSAYDSCRLISINLTGYVRNPFTNDSKFDFDQFKVDVFVAMRMADNLVDLELELISKIIDSIDDTESEIALWRKLYKAGEKGRRTGLGTHGLADALAQMNIKYDSDEAIRMVDEIYRVFRDFAYAASIDLAEKRGAFPDFNWEHEKDCPFINRLPKHLIDKMKVVGRRNISLLTQAPTGSVSIVSKVGAFNAWNVSSGVEPVFANFYIRRKKINPNEVNVRVDHVDATGDSWQHYPVFHKNVENWLNMHGYDSSKLKEEELANILPDFFVTSDKIDWMRRIEIQGTEQKYLDHSISSTINLPRGTQSSVVGQLYLEGWKKNLKGLTVYVDGSRDGVLVTNESTTAVDEELTAMSEELLDQLKNNYSIDKSLVNHVLSKILGTDPLDIPDHALVPIHNAPKRPEVLESETHKMRVDFGNDIIRNTYITVSFFPGTKRPYEVFVQSPYSGMDEKDLQILELAARTTSMNLRHGVPVKYICEQLDKIQGQYLFSIPMNISKVLKNYIDNDPSDLVRPKFADDFNQRLEEFVKKLKQDSNVEKSDHESELTEQKNAVKCPNCGKRTYVMMNQACGTCYNCGYSGCN